jgi:hypothetical protein
VWCKELNQRLAIDSHQSIILMIYTHGSLLQATVYIKGAEVIGMYQTLLGKEVREIHVFTCMIVSKQCSTEQLFVCLCMQVYVYINGR